MAEKCCGNCIHGTEKIGWESVQKFINERRSKQWRYKEIKE